MNKKGVSLVLVMGILVILGMVAIAFIIMSVTEMGVISYIRDHKMAFHAAEAGIDRLIARLPDDLSAFPSTGVWDTLPNKALYKSGEADVTPTPVEKVEETTIEETDVKVVKGYVFGITASGKKDKAKSTIDVRLRITVPGKGTQY